MTSTDPSVIRCVDGIFHIMSEMGIWTGPEPKVQEPAISSDGEVEFIRSKSDGVFLPLIEHNHYVKKEIRSGKWWIHLKGR